MASVTLHVHGSLTFFVDAGRGGTVDVPTPRPRSAKDAIESAGIPHPEVDLLLVDGASESFAVLLRGGERVDVFPADASPASATPACEGGPSANSRDQRRMSHVRPPPAPRRFVCDVHLGRLARRLRLLGFDTWYSAEAADDEIAAVAVDENRVLLTRDRGLLMRRVILHGYCPRSDDPGQQVIEVVRRYGLSCRVRPMSRCVRCNGVLGPVAKSDVVDRLPPHTRTEHTDFSQCDSCGHVYWPGSHLPHIEAFVRKTHILADYSTRRETPRSQGSRYTPG